MVGPKSKCTLQKLFEVTTGSDTTEEWIDIKTFECVLTELSAEEKTAPFDSLTVSASHKIHFSYRAPGQNNLSEVKEKNRIKIGDRIFDIQSAINRHNRFWEIEAVEYKGKDR